MTLLAKWMQRVVMKKSERDETKTIKAAGGFLVHRNVSLRTAAKTRQNIFASFVGQNRRSHTSFARILRCCVAALLLVI